MEEEEYTYCYIYEISGKKPDTQNIVTIVSEIRNKKLVNKLAIAAVRKGYYDIKINKHMERKLK